MLKGRASLVSMPLSRVSPHRPKMVHPAVRGRHRAAAVGLAGDSIRRRCADLRAHRIGQDAGCVFARAGRIGAQRQRGELADETRILYVSPLKALSNDVRVNLEIPLAGIAELARAEGAPLPEIRVAVRTGDTPMAERALMTRKAPHILVTTPESLFILLTAEKSRQMLRSVRTLIVDEIHAVAGSKRGSHLALSMARLEALAEGRVQKIGLSATVSPIEEVGRFLSDRAHIIQVGRRRDMDIAVEVPRDELGAVAQQRNVVGDLRPHGRAGAGASHHAGLRQHAAASRARRARAGRTNGRGHGAAASRQPVAAAASRSRAAAEARRAARGGGDGVARIGDRHRDGRSGVPDRFAAVDLGGAAAHRARGPLGGSEAQGPNLRDHSR